MRRLLLAATAALILSPLATASVSADPKVPIKDPGKTTLKKGDGWLGVSLGTVAADKAGIEGYGDELVAVDGVFAGSPAESSDFKVGDVILAVDKKRITAIKQLVETVRGTAPGSKVQFTIGRGGKVMKVPLLLGLRPDRRSLLKNNFVDRPAPKFAVATTDKGKKVTLESLSGKVVLVDFWATWCGPCRASIPHLNELRDKYKGDEFALIGITDEPPATVKKFRKKVKMSYATAHDKGRKMNQDYLVNALPTIFIIDHEGVVRDVIIGAGKSRFEEIKQRVADLIAQRAKAP